MQSSTASPRMLVLASGTKEGGGSGFGNLAQASRLGELSAVIAAVVSNHENGGVRWRADYLMIPFEHRPPPHTAQMYQELVAKYQADFVACSGWLWPVRGLDSRIVFNIHPGPLPGFGGRGMHGHRVHETVMESYKRGESTHSAVCMHFVTDFDKDNNYDRGPVFFRHWVEINPDDTPETLGKRVNAVEHEWQPRISDLVVRGHISWDGDDPHSLRVPPGYQIDR